MLENGEKAEESEEEEEENYEDTYNYNSDYGYGYDDGDDEESKEEKTEESSHSVMAVTCDPCYSKVSRIRHFFTISFLFVRFFAHF